MTLRLPTRRAVGMVPLTLVARWLLGGTFAVIAGLAAAAEPPAPTPWPGPAAISAVHAGARPAPVATALRPLARLDRLPAARWDGRDGAEAWTRAALAAAAGDGGLAALRPSDMDAWCPGYARAAARQRAAFWVGLVSALARHESGFDARAAGGGGRWLGLMQISPATARHHGCAATTGEALREAEANLACALRIMARTVARDGVVSAGGGGVAADWGPMSRRAPREEIRAWVSDQDYCAATGAVAAALRPPARPLVAAPPLVLAAAG